MKDEVNIATCGTCGRSWDDSNPTSWTPAPSGRCPFEYFHDEDVPEDFPVQPIEQRYTFTITIKTATLEQAQTVLTERLGFDEEYGFDYTLDWSDDYTLDYDVD